MCGIAGVYLHGGAEVEADVLQRMVVTLAHRGPDGAVTPMSIEPEAASLMKHGQLHQRY